LSVAILALTSNVDALRINNKRSLEEELETDNGDDYMAESIAEAEKEVKEKKGSIDMQKEIKQLEEDSEVKTTKPSDDMDVTERKHINKLTDEMTSEALESKSVLDFNGKDLEVKQNPEDQEHANFLSYNKQAVHEAYLDMKKELGVKSSSDEAKPEEAPEKKVIKKVTHDDQSLSENKSDEKEENGADSESESNSESDSEDDNKKKKKKGKKGKKGKKKKGKMKRSVSSSS
jgi:hypothetical protein